MKENSVPVGRLSISFSAVDGSAVVETKDEDQERVLGQWIAVKA